MSSYFNVFEAHYSFADYIINLITVCDYQNRMKRITEMMDQNHELGGYSPDSKYFVKYKSFKESYPFSYGKILFKLTDIPTYNLHEELVPTLNCIQQDLANFKYDMDKLKNFISFVERYADSREFVSKYVPTYFLENYREDILPSNIKRPKNISSLIDDKFKEEIPLLKRYFLWVRIHDME